MPVDFDTFLTTVYVLVDTALTAQPSAPRGGRPPQLSDSEVLALLLIGQFLGGSERHLLRWAECHLRPYFPGLLSQSSFNRRSRALAGRCALLMHQLLPALGVDQDAFEIVDGLAVPVANPTRGVRQAAFTAEEAALGHGGVGKQLYYGVAVLLSIAASGPITGLTVAPANTDERWLLSEFLTWRQDPTAPPLAAGDLTRRDARHRRRTLQGPTGPVLSPVTAGHARTNVYLADRGFGGAAWQTTWHTELAATVITPEQVPSPVRRAFRRARHLIETVNDALVRIFHLRYPNAHTQEGLITRIIAKCTAFNLGMTINRRFQRPDFALGTLFDG
jgi:hypothetical protein